MEGEKKKIDRLVQLILRSRLVRWFKRRDVSIQYLFLFIVLILFTIVWNSKNIYFGTFEINDNSARYLLSALIQSLAAIIAIVVTMTFVAVQLTASAYSPRVIDIFKNNRVMWLLIVGYGLSIFFGLFILETIGGTYSNLNPWGITFSLEFCIFLAYLMGIAAFAGLFWHMGNIIDLLKPEKIIDKLSEDITRENVLEFVESEEKQRKGQTDPTKDDPVQPIVAMIHGSVMKYDIATTRYGLKAITEKSIDIMDSNGYKISKHFCSHLEQIGKLAVNIGGEESVVEVIKDWGSILEKVASEKCDLISHTDIIDFEVFVISVTRNGFRHAAYWAAESLGEITRILVDAKTDYITIRSSLFALGKLGMVAAEKEFDGTAAMVVHASLLQIGTTLTGGSIPNKKGLCRITAGYWAQLEISTEKADIKYTPSIKPEDQEPFNEFTKLCETQLQELRTQKPN